LETEFTFTLPKGYVDDSGTLHRSGTMRLATARDEIEPLRDARITGPDDPYLTILVISRVVTQLGTLRQVTPNVIEGLFAADLAFLQDLYGIVNFGDPADAAQLQESVLPPQRQSAVAPPPASAPAAVPALAVVPQVHDELDESTDSDDDESEPIEPVSRPRSRIEEVTRVES
jgi:hypothetical protein